LVGVRAAARVAGLRSAKPRCRPECAVCDTLLGCISERGGLIADELSGVDGRGFVDSSCLGVGGISMAKVAGLGIFLVDAGAAAVGMEEGGWVGRASSLVCSGAGSFTLGVGATLADFFAVNFFEVGIADADADVNCCISSSKTDPSCGEALAACMRR
jgi:hypothetical protein